MNEIVEKLIIFCKFFKSVVKTINNETPNRTKIISFKDILYCCLYMNGNSCSYSLANINMYMNNIVDVSDNSLIKKKFN